MDPSPRTRTLVVMRHAKADDSGPSDHERRLTSRGRTGAADAGRWLRSCGLVPDTALVSDATRTRETWEEVASAAGWDLEPELSPSVYAGGPDTVLDLLRETSGDVGTLLLVGHNPTVAYLAELLDDGEGDVEASMHLMTSGFTPASAAVFDVMGDWSELAETSATLRGYHVGSS